jgi:hypothetical protein
MTEHPPFMSRQHVDALNRRLSEAAPLKALCAALDQDLSLLYEMTDETDGSTVCWHTRITRASGIVFSLERTSEVPDVVIRGGYWSIIDAVQGKGPMPEPQGDERAIARIMTILASNEIRSCAVQVVWPIRPA